ncbi:MAG: class I SAM-dependent methyltransferase [Acidobacteria bacterium]|nr:class I SAM-dependent methyltransferase [Acidobacteriota bacterium]MBI3425262.1 class I SAM-dependent methyltransferase [Acidobacteriota bacterium]
MPTHNIYSDYDSFAWFYNRYWGEEFSRPALVIFNILLFPHLPSGCRVLDLCCGTGQLAAGLCERGYQVTGLDGSTAMLELARQNAPAAEFVHADARSFRLPRRFQAVLSAFDSLNHLMEFQELVQVFRNVHQALGEDGVFLFDLNMEDESELFGQTLDMVSDDHVCLVRGIYDAETKLKRYEVTMFRLLAGLWQRSDVTLHQRYYAETEVLAALAEAGFRHVKTYDARREFGMTLSDGRMFYLARKE